MLNTLSIYTLWLFKLQTSLSLRLVFSLIWNSQCTTKQFNISDSTSHHCARCKSILSACVHCDDDLGIVLIIWTMTRQSSNAGAFRIQGLLRCHCFLDQSCHGCMKPVQYIWNSCRDVLRCYEHNCRQYLSQLQHRQCWYAGTPFNSCHSQCLLILKMTIPMKYKQQVNLVEKWLSQQK